VREGRGHTSKPSKGIGSEGREEGETEWEGRELSPTSQ